MPEKKDVRNQLLNVLVFSLADGKVTEEEKQYIGRLRDRLGVATEEFSALVKQVRDGHRSLAVSSDPVLSGQTFELLLELAQADGEIANREETILRKVGRRAGLTEMEISERLAGRPETDSDRVLSPRIEELYRKFSEWDEATRKARVNTLSETRGSVVALLRIMESYRTPDGASNGLGLKMLIAEQIGLRDDPRAVYYLAQQINLGNGEDELTSQAFREVVAEAIGRLVGQPFMRDEAGVASVRRWWNDIGRHEYSQLAI